MEYSLTPIGTVHSSVTDTAMMPIDGARAEIEIFDAYAEALDGVENNTHLVVLCFSHEADRTRLRVTPKKFFVNAAERGVFAARSPNRPNPIALDVVRLVERNGTRLTVDMVDMIDGTPVIDIKPYANELDCVFSAKRRNGTTATMKDDALLRTMLREAANFHGEVCVGVAIGVRMAFAATKRLGSLKDKNVKIISGARACTSDGIQAIASATNKRFRKAGEEFGAVSFYKNTTKLRFVVTTKKKYHDLDDVLTAPETELFDVLEMTTVDEAPDLRV